MIVNICGLPHKVVECEDKFDTDCHFGQIDYKTCEIRINKDLSPEAKKETLCHEMVHGILVHLGYNNLSGDEQLVQALGNAVYQGFDIKADAGWRDAINEVLKIIDTEYWKPETDDIIEYYERIKAAIEAIRE